MTQYKIQWRSKKKPNAPWFDDAARHDFMTMAEAHALQVQDLGFETRVVPVEAEEEEAQPRA